MVEGGVSIIKKKVWYTREEEIMESGSTEATGMGNLNHES